MDLQSDSKKIENNNSKTVCELCKVAIPLQQKSEHITGKKHQLALHQATVLETKGKCGIYVRGFPVTTTLEELKLFLSKYGEIVDGFIADNGSFSILQFKESSSVEKVLKEKLTFGGKHLFINRRKLKKQEDPRRVLQQTENFDSINKHLERIHSFEDQVHTLVNILQPNWYTMGLKYEKLCRDLQVHLSEIFPNCIAYPFGSTITGVSFLSSDVDVYIKVSNFNGVIPTDDNKASAYVNKSKRLLEKSPKIFSHLLAIPKAKTPIVKCVHNPTQLSCDFNFKNMLGVCNTYMIKYYLSVDRRLTSLMIVLKYWAKVHDLTGGSGKFSNYCLIILFIFYLQVHQFLPSVETVQNVSKVVNMQEGWNGGFVRLEKFDFVPLRNQTGFQIFQGFFGYYANFDYALHVVSPYLGSTLLKTDFLSVELLSDKFKLYKANILTQPPIKIETAICVQDPFQHNHNLSSAVPSRVLDDFVKLCKVGALLFKDKPMNNNSLLYRLFTDVGELALSDHFKNPNEYKFTLTMDSNCLLHLNHITNSKGEEMDVTEKTLKMRSAWFEVANMFVLQFLTKIMRFSIDVKSHDDDNFKSRRLNEQDSVHDTSKLETVTYHCLGYFNLWEARKSITKDLNIDPSLGILERQIHISNYMSNLYKNQNIGKTIIEFDLTADAIVNPVKLSCTISKTKALNQNFLTFRSFFYKNFQSWFDRYCKELDQNVNK